MRTKVNLGLGKLSVLEVVGFGQHVVTKMTGNAFFPAPSPDLAKVSTAATALQTAYDQAQGAGPAQTSVMYQARTALETLLIALGHYVEDVANDPVNVNTGAAVIIFSAGMDVKETSQRQKQIFRALLGELPGSVILIAESVKRGSHEWQYSRDTANPNGWIPAVSTTEATVTIPGLDSGTRYWFRHRSILPGGPTAYDGPANLIVQ